MKKTFRRSTPPALTLTLRTALVLLAATVLPAAAQGVWRCGSDGRAAYSDAPCPGGRTVDTGAPRSAADAAAARADLDRLQRWAGQARQQREHDEDRLLRASARAASLSPLRPAVTAPASASAKKPRATPHRRAHPLRPLEAARTLRAAGLSIPETTG